MRQCCSLALNFPLKIADIAANLGALPAKG
jgi:hypothetical protein